MEKIERRNDIPDWGVDSSPDARPGVPMEQDPPHALSGSHWKRPEAQRHPGYPVLKRMELNDLTPVYGTAQPLHGLSGKLRRAAYKLPEHQVRHWFALLIADRVDVLESRLMNDSADTEGHEGETPPTPGRKQPSRTRRGVAAAALGGATGVTLGIFGAMRANSTRVKPSPVQPHTGRSYP